MLLVISTVLCFFTFNCDGQLSIVLNLPAMNRKVDDKTVYIQCYVQLNRLVELFAVAEEVSTAKRFDLQDLHVVGQKEFWWKFYQCLH